MANEKRFGDEEWKKLKEECRKEFPNVKITRVDEDHDIMLIRQLLAKPMAERTFFLRVPTPDGRGSHL